MNTLAHQRIAVGEVEPEGYRALAGSWIERTGDRLCPELEELNPFEVPALVGSIVLFDIDGEDIRYRLAGEHAMRELGRDIVGKRLADALRDPDYSALVFAILDFARREPAPYLVQHRFRRPADGLTIGTRRLVLPYGRDGEVRRLQTYMLFEDGLRELRPGDVDITTVLTTAMIRIVP